MTTALSITSFLEKLQGNSSVGPIIGKPNTYGISSPCAASAHGGTWGAAHESNQISVITFMWQIQDIKRHYFLLLSHSGHCDDTHTYTEIKEAGANTIFLGEMGKRDFNGILPANLCFRDVTALTEVNGFENFFQVQHVISYSLHSGKKICQMKMWGSLACLQNLTISQCGSVKARH